MFCQNLESYQPVVFIQPTLPKNFSSLTLTAKDKSLSSWLTLGFSVNSKFFKGLKTPTLAGNFSCYSNYYYLKGWQQLNIIFLACKHKFVHVST